jgi:hypothetical protein
MYKLLKQGVVGVHNFLLFTISTYGNMLLKKCLVNAFVGCYV